MGMSLALSGIIGKTPAEVVQSLKDYAVLNGGGLEPADHLDIDQENCCIIGQSGKGVTVHYPYYYSEWDMTSEYLSRELKAPVFSFHIHDGDLWMYVLYVNGEIADQFNPVPDYWDEETGKEEIQAWKGNGLKVSHLVDGLLARDIERYLVRWDLDADQAKAYPEDTFENEGWQLLDFMGKLGLAYPLDDDRNPLGQVYKLWTKELELGRC
jgi:hypothetical protein